MIDAVVVGFTESSDGDSARKGMLHDLLLALMRADGSLQQRTFERGSGETSIRRGYVAGLGKAPGA